jgi:hypothetical protein
VREKYKVERPNFAHIVLAAKQIGILVIFFHFGKIYDYFKI